MKDFDSHSKRSILKVFTSSLLIALLSLSMIPVAAMDSAYAATSSSVDDKNANAVMGSSKKSNSGSENGDEANSFRFSSGKQIYSSDGADPSSSVASGGISTFSLEKHAVGGYSVFNTFDTYSRGYCTGSGYLKGIDVSEHNGNIDWAKVKASGVNFAIIRCGYGSDYTYQDDKKWLQNVKGCKAAGIPFGVYLYSYAKNTTMAASEAQHVIRCLNNA